VIREKGARKMRKIRVLVGRCKWKRTPGKPRRRSEDNIKVEIGSDLVAWIHVRNNM
jgi:hypothetical protein